MTHPADPIKPGLTAYETRFPVRGLRAEAGEWSMLPDSAKQVWARVEAACVARAIPAGHVSVPSEPPADRIQAAVQFALRVSLGGGYHWPDYMADLYRIMVGNHCTARQEGGADA